MRPYTKGAERLFHKVDWDRAVGLVIVVDPFDPGSLLYLPQAGYTDLIKTALANRSPLVVVHGLNDVVPSITTEVDTITRVEYRVYTVPGKGEVHRVPISQNSPLPPFRTPTTTMGVDPTKVEFEEPQELHSLPKKEPLPKVEESGNDSDKGSGDPSLEDPVFLGKDFYKWSSLLLLRRKLGPRGSGKDPSTPHLDPSDPEVKKTFPEPAYEDKPQGKLGLDYARVLNEIRSQLGIAVHRTIRSVTANLSRIVVNRPRSWLTFLPKGLEWTLSSKSVWPTEEGSPSRRPFRKSGRTEARLLHLYAWAGATLLARSARSLEWSFAVLGKFLSLWHNNGLKTACAAFKEAERVLMKFLSGDPQKASEVAGVRISLDKGLPTIFPRGLRRYIRDGHVIAIRLAFFSLSVANLLKYVAPTKLETITAPYNGILFHDDVMDKSIKEGVSDLLNLGGSQPKAPVWKGFHASVKSGPYGKAMLSAPIDAVALTNSASWNYFLEVSKYIKRSQPLVDNTLRLSWLTLNFLKPFWSGLIGPLTTGKLSKVIEPRGKVRVVAIPGYQVQSLLKPLHDSLFDFLRTLETDHTFNQDGGVTRCMNSNHKVMNSYDLSAATDRFPRWFEAVVLRYLYDGVIRESNSFARAWELLLESLVFSFRKTRKGSLQEITYGSGQPMGTYSSWATFAVSHHVCVMIAARRAGFPDFRDYDLLGDDIVLRGDSDKHQLVFDHYVGLMKDLGVGINPKKGVSSTNGSFEFAKRFVRGQDVLSSIRWKELSSITSWRSMTSFLLSLARRGLPLPHLRVALEVGYQLIYKAPYDRDITDIRRVPLVTQKAFMVPLVLFLSPIGPYKVPLVAWLSGRGASLVDFHPNLGHFINSIGEVRMGFDIHFPIAFAMKQVRSALLKRVLEAQGVAMPTLRVLLKTCKLQFLKNSGEIGLSRAIWKHLDPSHISNALRDLNLANVRSVGELITAIGPLYSKITTKSGQAALSMPLVRVMSSTCFQGPQEPGLYLGLLRLIVSTCPGFLVNREILRELLPRGGEVRNPDVNPDYLWPLGASSNQVPQFSDSLGDRITQEVAEVMPDKYQHPSQLTAKLDENITEFMKVSVTDILPSALPAHLDLFDLVSEAQGSAVMNAWRALRADPMFTTDNIYSFPERTDVSRAPEYVLEYTNAIRLCATPDLQPRPAVAKGIPRRLADEAFQPWVFKPAFGYEEAFVRKSDLSRDTMLRMFRMKLQESGQHFRSNLVSQLGH